MKTQLSEWLAEFKAGRMTTPIHRTIIHSSSSFVAAEIAPVKVEIISTFVFTSGQYSLNTWWRSSESSGLLHTLCRALPRCVYCPNTKTRHMVVASRTARRLMMMMPQSSWVVS